MMLTIVKEISYEWINKVTMHKHLLMPINDLQSLRMLDEITLENGYNLPIQDIGYSFQKGCRGLYATTGSDNMNDEESQKEWIKKFKDMGFEVVEDDN